MTKWKLSREVFGAEEFIFMAGDVATIGRAVENTLTLCSLVISRKHCSIRFLSDKAVVRDCGSSNGVYVGPTKIPKNLDYDVNNLEIIGIGWTASVPTLDPVSDDQKYMFKLIRQDDAPSEVNRYQEKDELDKIEEKIAALDNDDIGVQKQLSLISNSKLSLKRKLDDLTCNDIKKEIKEEKRCCIVTLDDDVISLSDSDNESQAKVADGLVENIKLEPISKENQKPLKNQIEFEKQYMELEAFNVKQEYMGYEDEPITVDSESDSESEHWYLRLSQNSPGKPFSKLAKAKTEEKLDDSSYSQMDDDFVINRSYTNDENEEEFMDDIITILPSEKSPEPANQKLPEREVSDIEEFDEDIIILHNIHLNNKTNLEPAANLKLLDRQVSDIEEFEEDIISLHGLIPIKSPAQQTHTSNKDKVNGYQTPTPDLEPIKIPENQTQASNNDFEPIKSTMQKTPSSNIDEVDGYKSPKQNETRTETTKTVTASDISRKAQMIEPRVHLHKERTKHTSSKSKSHKSSLKHDKVKKHSLKKHISNSQKEERKKKLKELATKVKECDNESVNVSTSTASISKLVSKVKIKNSNRGAFLTNTVQVANPVKKKDDQREEKIQHKQKNMFIETSVSKHEQEEKVLQSPEERENKKKLLQTDFKLQPPKKHEHKLSENKQAKLVCSETKSAHNKSSNATESRLPLKSLQIVPVKKPKKEVRFSEAKPEVLEFEIEPGNRMKKTSSVKHSLVDIRHMPVFSLEKITLMHILRWNPSWLDEQIVNNEPPPILAHNNPPMSIFHSFSNHHQYVQLVGDLLLMEIWECLTIAYMKIREQNSYLKMRIESLPPKPILERPCELFSLSVNISLTSHELKKLPRVGEILLIIFGPEKTKRFFHVHNVRCLPSPPNNIHSFYSIGLHSIYTDKMKSLRPGEEILAQNLAYISKELNLFQAVEYLDRSPLREAILRPQPKHFETKAMPPDTITTKWMQSLNPSQQAAVASSVAAALSDQPCINMVQGPPGTGKSSVICTIVMTYFCNELERPRQHRGKILICATSNAAVDELVIRLLDIRQSLPKSQRFRMVRVGRVEAMAARARDVSSQQLAQRDAARLHAAEPVPRQGLREEVAHLEAKINMWKSAAQDAKEPERVAYCQGRITELLKRAALVRAALVRAGAPDQLRVDQLRPDQLADAERRIIEGADIIVTTLASAFNHKMRGLRRRVALCIIDEAGQAIEPETLLPLTLDVAHLTLIGDPQQLPGYICSQRAKKHGLGESLFSRLSSTCEEWERNPVALLDQQYRMHADIADYPNRAFYGGLVRSAGPPRPDLPLQPYLILSIASGDKGQGACGGNEMEACGVARLVAALAGVLRPRALSLAVITPYHAHKDLIKKYLRLLQGPSESPVEVNTVDSFQGQERDVVVVSLARSHGVGFLTDTGRMNVMLTRARHALLVALNPQAMLKNDQWRTLIEDAQKRKMYRTFPNNMCQPITAGQSSPEDILKYIT